MPIRLAQEGADIIAVDICAPMASVPYALAMRNEVCSRTLAASAKASTCRLSTAWHWNNKIKEADAYIVVTLEYNHSLPGVLKNAIDSVFFSFGFRNKPIAAVGYSAGIGAGIRAIEHLAQVVIEAEAVPLRNTVVVPFVTAAFDEHGEPIDPAANVSLGVMLDDLAWWSAALETARAAGELVPGAFRARAALAAVQAAGDVEPAA